MSSCSNLDRDHATEFVPGFRIARVEPDETSSTDTSLEQSLARLADQITDVKQFVSMREHRQDPASETGIANQAEHRLPMGPVEEHIDSARVLYHKGIMYAGSVAGTVPGYDASNIVARFHKNRRQRTAEWVPEPPPTAGKALHPRARTLG